MKVIYTSGKTRRVTRVKKNPHNPSHFRIAQPSKFSVHHANARGEAAALIAEFVKKPDAVLYAQSYANAFKKPVVIVGKK